MSASAADLAFRTAGVTLNGVSSLATSVASTNTNAVLAVIGMIGILLMATLLTWLVMRFAWVPYRLHVDASTSISEGIVVVSLQGLFSGAVLATSDQAKATTESVASTAQTVRDNIGFVLGLLVVAALAIVWYYLHPQLLGAWLELRQCGTRALLDKLIFPLLNIGRLFYALVIPFLDAWAEMNWFITLGWGRLLFACTSMTVLGDLLGGVAGGIGHMLGALFDWLVGGIFNGGRIGWLAPVTELQAAFNETRPILDCFCLALAPVWDLLEGVLAIPSLPVFADCTVNVPARGIQLVFGVIATLELPMLSNLTTEAQCAFTSAGDVVEDLVQLVIQFVYDLFALIDTLLNSSTPAKITAAVYRADRYAIAATTSRKRGVEAVPITLTIARPLKTLGAMWHAAVVGLPEAKAAPGDMSTAGLFDMFQLFGPGANLTMLLGLDALLAVAGTPWSHIYTEIVVSGWGLGNITINGISHPIDAFSSPAGLKYWQYGATGDRLRYAADSLAQLTVLFDRTLPCSYSVALQGVASVPDGVLEFFWAFVYGIIFPGWLPGEPTPPAGMPVIDLFPAYYDWQGSRARRSLALLHEGEQCLAVVLGCNTRALNNNATNVTSNCTEAPFGCLGRSVSHLLEESLNQTLQFVLYIPQLVQFDASKHTFHDLSWERLRDAAYGVIFCVRSLIDALDGDDLCLTPDPPANRTGPNANATIPPDYPFPAVIAPKRTSYECDADGQAYYTDQRSASLVTFNPGNLTGVHYRGESVVVRVKDNNTAIETDVHLQCNPRASRGCAGGLMSDTFARVLGEVAPNATVPNGTTTVTIQLRPYLHGPVLNLTFNRTTRTFTDTQSSIQAQPGFASVIIATQYNCTDREWSAYNGRHALPRPVQMACRNHAWIWIDTFDSHRSRDRIGGIGGITGTPGCDYVVSPEPYDTIVGSFPFRVTEYDSSNDTYVARPVMMQVTKSPLVEVSVQLITDVTGKYSVLNASCYRNRLVGLKHDKITYYRNESVLLPIYYKSAVTGRQMPVTCDTHLVYPMACGGLTSSAPTLLFAENVTSYSPYIVEFDSTNTQPPNTINVPCTQPPPTPAQVTCTQFSIGMPVPYNPSSPNQLTMDVIVEGGDVRVSFNESDAARFQCDGVFSGAADTTPPLVSTAPLNIQNLWTLATAQVEREYNQRSTSRTNQGVPVASASTLATLAAAAASGQILQVAAADQARLNRLLAIARFTAASAYRKQTFLCYLSSAIEAIGDVLVSYIWEWVRTARTILTLPADPSEPFDVPTFETTRDNVRTALCDFVSAGAYLLPDTFACPELQGAADCDKGSTCLAHFLCDVLDVPILLLDIPVDVLRTVKAVVEGVFTQTDIFAGTACGPGNEGACVVGFLVYVVKKILFTVTLVFRGGAAVLDCILCAILSDCQPIIYTFVDSLADLIDGIGALFITSVLNFILGIVECIIYFFSGQFGKLVDAFLNQVLASIGSFFQGLGSLILQFLLGIPVIGDIIRFLVTIIRGACDVLQDVVSFFGGGDIGCASVSLKRDLAHTAGTATTGWIAGSLWGNVSGVWASGQPASAVCGARMAALNATDYETLTADDRREALFCLMASLWVGDLAPAAIATARAEQLFVNECDLLMPALYEGTVSWKLLPATTQARAVPCLEQRWRAEKVRLAATGNGATSWVPHDLFYTDSGAWVQLLDDARVAYDVYSQYAADRQVSPAEITSAAYAADWETRGYATAHLEALANLSAPDAVAAALASDDASLGLTIEQYAVRMATTGVSRKRGMLATVMNPLTYLFAQRTYSPARLAGMVRSVWLPLLQGSAATGNESISSFVWRTSGDALVAAGASAGLSISIDRATLWNLAAANDTALLRRTMRGAVQAVTHHLPAMAVTAWRLGDGQGEVLKRVVTGAFIHVPLALLRAATSLIQYGAESAMGVARANAEWYADPVARDAYIAAAAAQNITLKDMPLAAALVPTGQASDASSFASAAVRWFLPLGSMPLAQIGSFFATHVSPSTSDDSAKTNSIGTALPTRPLQLARFGKMLRLGLVYAAKADYRVQVAKGYGVSSGDGLECLTNYTTLCNECHWAEWFVYHLMHAASFISNATGGETNTYYCRSHPEDILCVRPPLGTIPYSYGEFIAFQAYSTDESVPAELGDSSTNPVRYPWHPRFDLDNWGLIGDPTPDKLRFNDITSTAATTWNVWVDGFNAGIDSINWSATLSSNNNNATAAADTASRYYSSSAPLSANAFWAQVNAPPSVAGAGPNMASIVVSQAVNLARLLPPLPRLATSATTSASTSSSRSTGLRSSAFTPPPLSSNSTSGESVVWWLEFVWWRVRACSYDTELNGATKRFSIGEVVLMAVGVALAAGLVLAVVVPGNFLMLFAGIGSIFGLVLLFGGLVVAYDWSYGCLPALPVPLADDAMWFLSHTLAPKCPAEGGIIDQADWNATTCYACDGYSSGRWTVPSFTLSRAIGGRFGFEDLTYNLAFILHELAPSVLQLLQDTSFTGQIPIVGPIVKSSVFQARLTAFDAFNASIVSDATFSQMHWGNVFTLICNVVIVLVILVLVVMALPLLRRAFSLFFSLIYLAALAFFIVVQAVGMIGSMAAAETQSSPPPQATQRRASRAAAKDDVQLEMQSMSSDVRTPLVKLDAYSML